MSGDSRKRKKEKGVAYREALYRLGFRNTAVRSLLRQTTEGWRGARDDASESLREIAEKGGNRRAVLPLMDAMWDKDEKVRMAAAMLLGEMGEKAEGAVHALVRVVKDDENEDVRCAAVWALGRVGKGAKKASPELKELMINGSKHFRYTVAFALPKMDDSATEALPVLREALKEKGKYSDALREKASESLIAFGEKAEPAIPDLITALNDKNETVSENAALALERIGGKAVIPIVRSIEPPERAWAQRDMQFIKTDVASKIIGGMGEKAVPPLIDTVHNGNWNAIWLLGELGEKAVPAIPALIGALDYEDSNYGIQAVCALGKISEKSDEAFPGLILALKSPIHGSVRETAHAALRGKGDRAIPKLISLLGDNYKYLREGAAEMLGGMGETAKAGGAVPALVGALKDVEKDVRFSAAFALHNLEAKEVAAVPVLIEALEDARPAQRIVAAAALGEFGEKAADAAFTLAMALDDSEKQVAENAEKALVNIGEKAFPAVENVALKHNNRKVREKGLDILEKFAEETDAVIPAFSTALGDKEVGIRLKAVEILNRLAVTTDAVIPALSTALDDEKPEIRLKAIGALGGLAERTDAVIPAFAKALKDGNVQVRSTAIASLGKLGEKAAPAMPALINALGDSELAIRGEASKTLASIGEKAVPALIGALEHSSDNVRFGAIEALGKMGEKASPAAPSLVEILNTDMNNATCLQAARVLCKIEGTAVLPRLHKAALSRPDLKDGLVRMIREVSSSGSRPTGVREVFARPPESELERLSMFRSRALDADAKRNVVRS